MNILLIDSDLEIIEICDIISRIERNWNFISSTNYHKTLEIYNKENIELVIVDFSNFENREILKEIISLNEKQKTITISLELNYSESRGCEYCIENLYRRRLLKPIQAVDLYNLIINFDNIKCRYYNTFKNIEKILSEIISRYKFFVYDKNLNSVVCTNEMYLKNHYSELLSIVDFFNEQGIKYKIYDDRIQLY